MDFGTMEFVRMIWLVASLQIENDTAIFFKIRIQYALKHLYRLSV